MKERSRSAATRLQATIDGLLADARQRSRTLASTVAVDVARGPGDVAVAVTDHGPGIPADQQARAFERFWRATSGGGAGLGLPIARQVADAHAGSLTLESPGPTGDGCRFTLRLPTVRVGGNGSG